MNRRAASRGTHGLFVPLARSSERQWYRDAETRDGFHRGDLNAFRSLFRELAMAEEALALRDQEIQDEYQLRTQRVSEAFRTLRSSASQLRRQLKQKELDMMQLLVSDDILNRPLPSLSSETPLTVTWLETTEAHWNTFATKLETLFSIISSNPELSSRAQAAMIDTERVFKRSMVEWKASHASFREDTAKWTTMQLKVQRVVCPITTPSTQSSLSHPPVLPSKYDTNRDIREALPSLRDPTVELSVLDRIAFLYRQPPPPNQNPSMGVALNANDASTWDLAQRCLDAKLGLQQAEGALRQRVRTIAASLRMGRNRVLEYLVQSIADAIQDLIDQLKRADASAPVAGEEQQQRQQQQQLMHARDALFTEAKAQRTSYEQAIRALGEKAKRTFDQYRVVNRLVRDLKWPLQTSPTFAQELMVHKFPFHEYGQFRSDERSRCDGELAKHEQMAVRMMLQPARVSPEFRGIGTLWSCSDIEDASMIASLISLNWQKYERFRRHHSVESTKIEAAPKFSRLHVLILTRDLGSVARVARLVEHWLLIRERLASWTVIDGDASEARPYLWVELPGAFHVLIHASTHACSGNVLLIPESKESANQEQLRPHFSDWSSHLNDGEVGAIPTPSPIIHTPNAQEVIDRSRGCVLAPVRLPIDRIWGRPLPVIVLDADGLVECAESFPADKPAQAAFSWAEQLHRHHPLNVSSSDDFHSLALEPKSWLQTMNHELLQNRSNASRIRTLLRFRTFPFSAARCASIIRALSLVLPNSRCIQLAQERHLLPWITPVSAWTSEMRVTWSDIQTRWLNDERTRHHLFGPKGYAGVLSVVDLLQPDGASGTVLPRNFTPSFQSLANRTIPYAIKTSAIVLRVFFDNGNVSLVRFELRQSRKANGIEKRLIPVQIDSTEMVLPALVKCIQELPPKQCHLVAGLDVIGHTASELARQLGLPCLGLSDVIDAVSQTFRDNSSHAIKFKMVHGQHLQLQQVAHILQRHLRRSVLDLSDTNFNDLACRSSLTDLIHAVGGKKVRNQDQAASQTHWYDTTSIRFPASIDQSDSQWKRMWRSLLGSGEPAHQRFWRALMLQIHRRIDSILVCSLTKEVEESPSNFTHVLTCPANVEACWGLCNETVSDACGDMGDATTAITNKQTFIYLRDSDASRWNELDQAYIGATTSALVWKRALLESSYDCHLLQGYHTSPHFQYRCIGGSESWRAEWKGDTMHIADWMRVRCKVWKPVEVLESYVISRYTEADALMRVTFKWTDDVLMAANNESGSSSQVTQCDDAWTAQLFFALAQSDAGRISELLDLDHGQKKGGTFAPLLPFQTLIGRRLSLTSSPVIRRYDDLARARLMWNVRRQEFLDRKLALQERLQQMDWLKPDDPDAKWAYLNPVTQRRVSSRDITGWSKSSASHVDILPSSFIPAIPPVTSSARKSRRRSRSRSRSRSRRRRRNHSNSPGTIDKSRVYPLPADVSNDAFALLSTLDRKLSTRDRKMINQIKHAYETHPDIALFGDNPFQAGPVELQTRLAKEALLDIRRRYGVDSQVNNK